MGLLWKSYQNYLKFDKTLAQEYQFSCNYNSYFLHLMYIFNLLCKIRMIIFFSIHDPSTLDLCNTGAVYDCHIFITSSLSFHGFITNQLNNVLPVGGRALHWYRRGQRLESCTSLNIFFRLSFHNCKSCVYN